MKRNLLTSVAVVAVAAGAMMPSAIQKANAQEMTASYSCQVVGANSMEPLGDREGHGLGTLDYSCLVTAGLMSGGVVTGHNVTVFDKSGGTLLMGGGVIRKPDATVVYQQAEEKVEFTMNDGKVTGFTATGRGHVVMAVGGAASFSGMPYVYTAKSTGLGQFSVEQKSK